MLRKITLAIAVLLTISAFGQQRKHSAGSGGVMDAALAPIAVPGTTVSGKVTSVSGNIIALANGAVTIDASGAKIVDDHGGAGSLSSIAPGTTIFAVLNAVNVAPNAPLPAVTIAVHRQAEVTLTGPVQAKGTDTITVLGRAIKVDANTSFGGRGRSLADIVVGDVVIVEANAAAGGLLATSVMTMTPLPKTPTIIHGTVKSIGADSWVITDTAGKEWTIAINAQTKIIGTPKVGDTVEILVNTDTANQYVAVSIIKSPVVLPFIVFSGQVKSIAATQWVVHDSRSGKDITVAVNAQTQISGSPQVNDGVIVTANVDSSGNYTATSIIKLGIVPPVVPLTGVVKAINPHMTLEPCPPYGCIIAAWIIGPAAGLGPDFQVIQTAGTKITGDPHVGDRVIVFMQTTAGTYVATEIRKQ